MLITLEGIDGCGKSTQARLMRHYLNSRFGEGQVLWTRQPGDWAEGPALRQMLLHAELEHPLSELFLFLVDRCENVKTRILPALDRKQVILCERYCDSTLAYQSWGRGLSRDRIESLFEWCDYPVPDLTFWLDLPVEQAWDRLTKRGEGRDRIEKGALSFLERIREGYSLLARQAPERIVPVDASSDEQTVFRAIRSILDSRLSPCEGAD